MTALDPGVPVTRGLSVSAVNDAPTVLTSARSASFTEDGPAAARSMRASRSVTLTPQQPTAATVQITSGYVVGQDVLTFASQSEIQARGIPSRHADALRNDDPR